MKNLLKLVFASLILINAYIAADVYILQDNIDLSTLFNEAYASGEHTATYDCYDEETYYEEQNMMRNRLRRRVCAAPDCERKYISNSWSYDKGKCTVSY